VPPLELTDVDERRLERDVPDGVDVRHARLRVGDANVPALVELDPGGREVESGGVRHATDRDERLLDPNRLAPAGVVLDRVLDLAVEPAHADELRAVVNRDALGLEVGRTHAGDVRILE